jgi:hypothetical protein
MVASIGQGDGAKMVCRSDGTFREAPRLSEVVVERKAGLCSPATDTLQVYS